MPCYDKLRDNFLKGDWVNSIYMRDLFGINEHVTFGEYTLAHILSNWERYTEKVFSFEHKLCGSEKYVKLYAEKEGLVLSDLKSFKEFIKIDEIIDAAGPFMARCLEIEAAYIKFKKEVNFILIEEFGFYFEDQHRVLNQREYQNFELLLEFSEQTSTIGYPQVREHLAKYGEICYHVSPEIFWEFAHLDRDLGEKFKTIDLQTLRNIMTNSISVGSIEKRLENAGFLERRDE